MTDIEKTTKTLIQAASKIYERISKAKALKILNQELVIKIPELLGEYSVAVEVRRQNPFKRTLSFPISNVTNVSARSLFDFSNESQAINRVENGFELSVKKIRPQTEKLLLNFEYRLENDRFLNDLVHRDVQLDISKSEGDVDEYWMHAQLKQPKILRSNYGRLDLRDIDMGVNVAVHQDLKTAIPYEFIRNLQIIQEWIKTGDRTKKWRLGYQHLRLSPQSFTGKEHEILGELQKLFLPTGFQPFVEVTNPFRYYDSVRGADFYDIPFSSLPKTMRVISRTSLNLDNPAAEGKLVYKKNEFKGEIKKIVGEPRKTRSVKPKRAFRKRVDTGVQIEEKSLGTVKEIILQKLRPTIREPPKKEAIVSDALENLFLTLEYDFKREKVSFPFSTKYYVPDFTSESLSIAIDVKLCKLASDEKRVIDEINADIPAYKTRYKNLIFLVYDLGCIRDACSFAKEIEESSENIFVLVVKH